MSGGGMGWAAASPSEPAWGVGVVGKALTSAVWLVTLSGVFEVAIRKNVVLATDTTSVPSRVRVRQLANIRVADLNIGISPWTCHDKV